MHKNGVVVVVRKSLLQGVSAALDGRKGREIMKFSMRSMSRLIATVNASDVQFSSMVTLTYPAVFPHEGKAIKTGMNSLLTMFRDNEWGEYLWFLEFQKRGAPHFHILSEVATITPKMRVRLSEKWVGLIANSKWFDLGCERLAFVHGMCVWPVAQKAIRQSFWFTMRSETWERIRDAEGGKKYATKYAAKEYQKQKPTSFDGVGRYWGCSKKVMLGVGEYREMSEEVLRKYLVAENHVTASWEVLPKYLFNVTGEQSINP